MRVPSADVIERSVQASDLGLERLPGLVAFGEIAHPTHVLETVRRSECGWRSEHPERAAQLVCRTGQCRTVAALAGATRVGEHVAVRGTKNADELPNQVSITGRLLEQRSCIEH